MLIPFDFSEFRLFTRDKVSDPDWDGARLKLKRKLKTWGDAALKAITSAHELKLKAQTSLHRPYKFNNNRVDCQRVLLTPTKDQKRKLASLLGDAFKEDVASGTMQMTISLSIFNDRVETALKVHPAAWWDGGAWQKAFSEDPNKLLLFLTSLPEDFFLSTSPKGQQRRTSELDLVFLGRLIERFKPAEQWISVFRVHPSEGLLEGKEDQEGLLIGDLVDLAPLYKWVKGFSMA